MFYTSSYLMNLSLSFWDVISFEDGDIIENSPSNEPSNISENYSVGSSIIFFFMGWDTFFLSNYCVRVC